MAGLVGRAKTIVQLKPRNPENSLKTSIPIKAICDYRQIEVGSFYHLRISDGKEEGPGLGIDNNLLEVSSRAYCHSWGLNQFYFILLSLFFVASVVDRGALRKAHSVVLVFC